jgi:hypothetical protein
VFEECAAEPPGESLPFAPACPTGGASGLESSLTAALRQPAGVKPLGAVDVHEGALDLEVPFVWPDDPDPVAAWERVAVREQDRLVDLEREFRQKDAERTIGLVDAYESAMQDLERRKGSNLGGRGSLGAQAFFKSVGLQLSMSPLRVAHLVDTAMALRDHLPTLWAAYLAGEAPWRAFDLAVEQAHGLDAQHWAGYDAEAADAVVDTAASRLKAELRRIRERLQDDTAGERAKRTRDRRNVVVDQGHDGEATLSITGPALGIIGFDQALTKAAIAAKGHEDETRSLGQLRHDIAMDLLVEGVKQAADPAWQALSVPQRKGVVPAPVLTIPALAALKGSGEQAHLVGYGPLDLETAKQAAGAAKSFVRVLTDPFTGVRIDVDRTLRVPPADMRRWIVLRDELCRFPGCNRPAHLCDVDHMQEWQDEGVTAIENLMSVCRPDHAAKSIGLWQNELADDGGAEWRDPWGHVFVDPPPVIADPAPSEYLPPPTPDTDDCPF